MNEVFLSIIIPAYNEESRIESTLKAIVNYLSKKDFTYEIIVVDDGSSDKTTQVVSDYLLKINHLQLITLEKNLGKGAAVSRGMLEARGLWRIFTDADNATPIEELDRFLPLIATNDIIIGSIATHDAKVTQHESFTRNLAGKFGNWLIRKVMNIPFLDTQRGFKLFSKEATKAIFPYIKTSGWGFDIEVLALAVKKGFRIKEVGIVWAHKAGSKVGIIAYLEVLWELITIKRRINRFNELGK